MIRKSEPWYIHTVLYVVILILIYLLIRVAIIDPTEIVEAENYYKTESRLRMTNIKAAEIVWEERFGHYTDNLDSLITFISTDSLVHELMVGVDSVTGRSSNPFKNLSSGNFVPESLFLSPKTFSTYVLQIDTSIVPDTIINRRGKITKIDTIITIGTKYYLEDPDGYGTVGDLTIDAKKNTASWE